MKTRRVRSQSLRGAAIAAAAMLWCLPASLSAAERENSGKTAYLRYCGSCHGNDGKGDGPLANMLTTKPTDLTQIAKNAGGQFPTMKVIQSIDGTTPVAGHGTAEMPVWGERFQAQAAHAQGRATARGKVVTIAEYLRSIQMK